MPRSPALRSMQSAGKVLVVQAATGDLVANATTDPTTCRQYDSLVLYLSITKLTMPDTADEVDFYFQTTYDDTNYVDLENVHYANTADGTTPKLVLMFGLREVLAGDSAPITPTDGALSDDTKVRLPLGSKFRIKAVLTETTGSDMTYAYVATGVFR